VGNAKVTDLHTHVGHAGVWVAVRQISVRGLAILQLLILAKILTPADFGLFAIAMIAYAFIEAMTFLGFGHALIQRKNVDDIDLDTLFVVNIGRGVLLAVLVFALSKPISWLMNSVDSWELIASIGLLPLIIGLNNPAMILIQKELRMKQEILFYLSGALANLCISLLLAMQGYGAWSLLLGLVVQSIAQLVMSYVICKYRPSMRFSRSSFAHMFDFGKWILASQGLKYFSNNLPSWVIGHYLGVQSLGIYHVAGRFSQAIGSEFATLVSTVAFPAFSKIIGDNKRLANAYLRNQKIILSSSFFIFGAIIGLSQPFAKIFFNNEWAGIGTIISLLALIGAIQSIGSQAEIMKALNLTKTIAKYSLIRLLIVIAMIFYSVQTWGAIGAIIAILVPTILTLAPSMLIILRELNIKSISFLQIILAPLISFAIISCFGLIFDISGVETFGDLIILAVVYLVLYVSVLALIDIALKSEIIYEWKILAGRLLNYKQ